MTYCSQILAEKEKEIQQLKKERDEWKNHYEDACFDCHRKKQVEAAKTILNEYCDGCSRFKKQVCTLKQCSICSIKKLREVLAGETTK